MFASPMRRRRNGWRVVLSATVFLAALWGNVAAGVATPVAAVAPTLVAIATATRDPLPDATTLTSQRAPIGDDFATFFTAHQGERWLGEALTPELPVAEGREQIFQGGVLLLNATNGGAIAVRPVVATLIGAGAREPIGDATSAITYATLASGVTPAARVPAPWWWANGAAPATYGIFVRQGRQGALSVGHYIPAVFAMYLTSFGTWQQLFGLPLAEATVITPRAGSQLLAQPFEHAVLLANLADPPDTRVQPAGADDLAIFGLPASVTGTATSQVWITADNQGVLLGPAFGPLIATLSAGFPVQPLGDGVWIQGQFWRHIAWDTLDHQRDGWVTAAAITTAPPATAGPQFADLNALAPGLGALAAAQSDSLGVAIFVPDANRMFTYDQDLPLTTASTFKIPILLTLLWQTELQHRALTSDEQALAAAMIEESDNDAAAALYAEINYDQGINAFMSASGIGGLTINTQSFGESTITPLAMTRLLNALWSGSALNGGDRQYALDLMSHVDPQQQGGLGAVAPAGATVALKDGWIQDDDGWVTNSVGIVTANGHTVIISVYARRQATLDWTVVNNVCAAIMNALYG